MLRAHAYLTRATARSTLHRDAHLLRRPTTRETADRNGRRLRSAGIYGGVPTADLRPGETLDDYGINAIWIGSAPSAASWSTSLKSIARRPEGLRRVQHDARGGLPEGSSRRPADRRRRPGLTAARRLAGRLSDPSGLSSRSHGGLPTNLAAAPIDGIWLDYHHAHANWEQASPNLPDTCFCDRCLSQFQQETGIALPDARRPSAPDGSWSRTSRPGCSGAATSSPTGSANSARSSTRNARRPAGNLPLPMVGIRARPRDATRSWPST